MFSRIPSFLILPTGSGTRRFSKGRASVSGAGPASGGCYSTSAAAGGVAEAAATRKGTIAGKTASLSLMA
jgi:hypothetical protein